MLSRVAGLLLLLLGVGHALSCHSGISVSPCHARPRGRFGHALSCHSGIPVGPCHARPHGQFVVVVSEPVVVGVVVECCGVVSSNHVLPRSRFVAVVGKELRHGQG